MLKVTKSFFLTEGSFTRHFLDKKGASEGICRGVLSSLTSQSTDVREGVGMLEDLYNDIHCLAEQHEFN